MREQILIEVDRCVSIDQALERRRIVPALQIIQFGFFVINISMITQRVALTQRIGQRTSQALQSTPSIVLVFYNKGAGIVK